MPFSATCPGCGNGRTVPDEGAGKRVRCRACGATFWAGNADVEVVDDEPADDRGPPPPRRSRGSDRDHPGRRGGEARRASLLPLVLGGVALLLVVGGLAVRPRVPRAVQLGRTGPGRTPVRGPGGAGRRRPWGRAGRPALAGSAPAVGVRPGAAVYPWRGAGTQGVLGWRVKYRFVEGGPRPVWYYCAAQYPNGPMHGRGVAAPRRSKAERVLHQADVAALRPDRPGSPTPPPARPRSRVRTRRRGPRWALPGDAAGPWRPPAPGYGRAPPAIERQGRAPWTR